MNNILTGKKLNGRRALNARIAAGHRWLTRHGYEEITVPDPANHGEPLMDKATNKPVLRLVKVALLPAGEVKDGRGRKYHRTAEGQLLRA